MLKIISQNGYVLYIEERHLWLLWLVLLALSAVIGAAVVYHWRRYGMKTWVVRLAETIFGIGTIAILASIAILITFI